MAVMDEFKEEREALKNGTPKQKLAYFWYYYKWHVIIALVVIIMIVSFVKQLTDRKDPSFYAVMLNASLLDQMTSEQPDFVTDFAEKEGIDLTPAISLLILPSVSWKTAWRNFYHFFPEADGVCGSQ